MPEYRKKLIEVALPLEAINRESAREKSIRQGHPSTLHLWWARRPLAACRAVLFASIVDDPSSRTEEFPTEAEQERERQRLFRIIEELIRWDNSNNETVLERARAEIMRATDGNPPVVLDPFCGGGSIPLEAQRLGLEVHASDLNPVAVLITKALIEIPPKFAGQPPMNPEARRQLARDATWNGAQGLAEDVRYYGKWMRDEAYARIGHLYPTVTLSSGAEATVVAWLWARTATCPNPACRRRMPLMTSLVLSKRKGREVSLEPVADGSEGVSFVTRQGQAGNTSGSVGRTGATCLACGTPVPLSLIREEARRDGLPEQLVAVVADGARRRLYVDATDDQVAAAVVDRPEDVPETAVPLISGIFNTPIYGIDQHWKLFTNRQLVAMTTFADLVVLARDRAVADGATGAYADAISVYLALGVGRLANRCSKQCFWDAGGEGVMQVFARQALPMVWTFAEANPFSDSSGNFLGQIDYLVEALRRVPAHGAASVEQRNAVDVHREGVVVSTDPPYYNNIPYADLSDFFYVWIRRVLQHVHPDLVRTLLVPKEEELIADRTRHGGEREAAEFFERGLRQVFSSLVQSQAPDFPLTIFYAFRQAEKSNEADGRVSTGWETMLEGVLGSGLAVHGTWPIRTEQPGGLREVGRNALASSIVLVCRERAADAETTTRRDFVNALRAELPSALKQLQHGNTAPVDFAQAAIGPGMAVFSRYAKVLESDGSPMRVRAALGLINQALDEILAEQEGDFDSDTRFAVTWFEQRGSGEGPYGEAEVLAKAKDTSVGGMVEAGVLASRPGKVRLLRRDEMEDDWDPVEDTRPTAWEAAQHLVRRLAEGGEDAAAELLARLRDGYGEQARELAYRLYSICERKGWAQEAMPYNALVVAWPEIARRVAGTPEAEAQQALEV